MARMPDQELKYLDIVQDDREAHSESYSYSTKHATLRTLENSHSIARMVRITIILKISYIPIR
jgi:hypothetical protein